MVIVVGGYLGNGEVNVIFTELRLFPMSEKLPDSEPISGKMEMWRRKDKIVLRRNQKLQTWNFPCER